MEEVQPKVRRWWRGTFFMETNKLDYKGSIKKMSDGRVEVVLTNSVYNFHHRMMTDFGEIFDRARSLVPELLCTGSAANDDTLVRYLPKMIELREIEKEEEEKEEMEEKEEKEEEEEEEESSLVLGFKLSEVQTRERDERRRRSRPADDGGDVGAELLCEKSFSRSSAGSGGRKRKRKKK
jgi:hypothetical protein